MNALFEFVAGDIPLLVSFPHSGTWLPPDISARMTEEAHVLPDTDWHVPILYSFVNDIGASRIVAMHSRYVIDLNRPPDSAALYPGQKNTGLVPTETFAGRPLYRPGAEPDDAEKSRRRAQYYDPYHAALQAELARICAKHGYALLWDAHSIASKVPALFEGRLPDLNIGTNGNASAPRTIGEALLEAGNASGFSCVLNGRFKGGHITRHYGKADSNIFAVQLEMAQIIYMDERPPYAIGHTRAPRVQAAVHRLIETYLRMAGRHFNR